MATAMGGGPSVNLGTLRASIDANTRAYERAMARMEVLTVATTRKIEKSTDPAAAAIDRLDNRVKNTTKGFIQFKAAIGAIKIGTIASAAMPAANALQALGGGAVIAVQSLTPLAGALGGLPFLLGAAAQSVVTMTLGLKGLSNALKNSSDPKKWAEALKELDPASRKAAITLKGLQPLLKQLQTSAAKGIAPGIADGLSAAAKNISVFKKILTSTGKTLGGVFRDLGKYIGSGPFGTMIETLSGRMNKFVRNTGKGFVMLFDSVVRMTVAAKPLTDAMTRWVLQGSKYVSTMINMKARSGELTKYFATTVAVMKSWGRTLRDFGASIGNVFKGATPLGREFMYWIELSAKRTREWTENNKREISAFFNSTKAPLVEFGKLLGDVMLTFMRLGSAGGMDDLANSLSKIRTELLPALEAIAQGVGTKAIDNLIDLGTGVAKFINIASFKPILELAGAFGNLANAIANLANSVPFLGTFLGNLLAIKAVLKIMNFKILTEGLSKVWTLAKAVSVQIGAQGLGASLRTLNSGMKANAKGTLIATAAIAGMATASSFITKNAVEAVPKVKLLEKGLLDLAKNKTGVLATADGIGSIGGAVARITDPSEMQRFEDFLGTIASLGSDSGPVLEALRVYLGNTDQALANLVNSGNAQAAAEALRVIIASAEEAQRKAGGVDPFTGQPNDPFSSIDPQTRQKILDQLPIYKALMEEVGSATEQAKIKTQALVAQLNDLNSQFQNALTTEASWRASMDENGKALDKLKNPLNGTRTELDLLKPAGQKAAAIFGELASEASEAATAAADQGKWGKATQILKDQRKQIYGQLREWGMSKKAAWDYTNQILAIPTDWLTEARIDDEEAKRKIRWIESRIKATKNWPIKITASATITYTGTGRAIYDKDGGYIKGYDGGGAVRGPGGKRTDSIPARLSRGEYVMQAAAVDKYGVQMFDALNSMRFANGGIVGFAKGGSTEDKRTRKDARADFRSGGFSIRGLAGLPELVVSPVREMYRSLRNVARGFISAGLDKQLDRMSAKLNRKWKKLYGKNGVQERLEKRQEELRGLKEDKKNYAANLKSQMVDYGSATSAWGDVQNGNMLAGQNIMTFKPGQTGAAAQGQALLTNMTARLNKIKVFWSDVTKLKSMGLNNTMIQEILNAGPDEGGAMAKAILASPALLNDFNNVTTGLDSYAKSMGNTASGWMYDAGIATVQGLIDGLKKQKAALQLEMKGLAAIMLIEIKKALGIKSPSREFMKVADYTVEGLVKGIGAGEKDAARAVTGLYDAMTGVSLDMPARLPGTAPDPSTGVTGLPGGVAGVPIVVQIDMRGAKVGDEFVEKIEEAARTGINAALSKAARMGAVGG